MRTCVSPSPSNIFSTASDNPEVNLSTSPCLTFSSSPAKTLKEITKVVKNIT